MTQSALDLIVADHQLWLSNPLWGAQANLTSEDLTGLTFRKADMDSAIFVNAILHYASLRGCGLMSADFTGASLLGADLSSTDCIGALFVGTDCRETSFRHANLDNADFTGADMAYAMLLSASADAADFTNAVMKHADLRKTDFTNATFAPSDLCGAVFGGTVGVPYATASWPFDMTGSQAAFYNPQTGFLNVGCLSGDLPTVQAQIDALYGPAAAVPDPVRYDIATALVALCQTIPYPLPS